MGSRITSINRAAWNEALLANGAVEIEWLPGSKHDRFRATRADGSTVVNTVPWGRQEPYKIRGWARQLMRRPVDTTA